MKIDKIDTDLIIREITPLSDDDFFVVQNHTNAKFDFPTHFHPEYEMNLVVNSYGKRIIGDSIQPYGDFDMVLVGPYLPHSWCESKSNSSAHVITVQFHSDFLSEKTLGRRIFQPISQLLLQANRGVKFSPEIVKLMMPRLESVSRSTGFNSMLSFLSILEDLANSGGKDVLAVPFFSNKSDYYKSRRINKVIDYMNENYENKIMLSEVAELVNMSETAFSHFFKKRTQRSFTDYLTGLRIGVAAKLLATTKHNISEICYKSGFNNIANFNRTFKRLKGYTPKEFRNQQWLLTKH